MLLVKLLLKTLSDVLKEIEALIYLCLIRK